MLRCGNGAVSGAGGGGGAGGVARARGPRHARRRARRRHPRHPPRQSTRTRHRRPLALRPPHRPAPYRRRLFPPPPPPAQSGQGTPGAAGGRGAAAGLPSLLPGRLRRSGGGGGGRAAEDGDAERGGLASSEGAAAAPLAPRRLLPLLQLHAPDHPLPPRYPRPRRRRLRPGLDPPQNLIKRNSGSRRVSFEDSAIQYTWQLKLLALLVIIVSATVQDHCSRRRLTLGYLCTSAVALLLLAGLRGLRASRTSTNLS